MVKISVFPIILSENENVFPPVVAKAPHKCNSVAVVSQTFFKTTVHQLFHCFSDVGDVDFHSLQTVDVGVYYMECDGVGTGVAVEIC